MAKVSIYVPEEMKWQMDELGDQVNWSQIAQSSFAQAISNEQVKRNRNMNTVIERLRASRNTYQQQNTEGGKKAGREWAELRAEYGHLKSMAGVAEYLGNFEEGAEAFHAAVGDPGNSIGETLRDFFGAEGMTSEYLRGFIEGAAEVWNEVKDKL